MKADNAQRAYGVENFNARKLLYLRGRMASTAEHLADKFPASHIVVTSAGTTVLRPVLPPSIGPVAPGKHVNPNFVNESGAETSIGGIYLGAPVRHRRPPPVQLLSMFSLLRTQRLAPPPQLQQPLQEPVS